MIVLNEGVPGHLRTQRRADGDAACSIMTCLVRVVRGENVIGSGTRAYGYAVSSIIKALRVVMPYAPSRAPSSEIPMS